MNPDDPVRGMNNAHRRKNFTPSDDLLIRQQPVTGIGLKRLAELLRTSQQALRQRATELNVSLVFGAESDGNPPPHEWFHRPATQTSEGHSREIRLSKMFDSFFETIPSKPSHGVA
jgi:hypothetical protein